MLLDLEKGEGELGTSEAQRNLRNVDAAPHSESSNAEISLVASASNILAKADEKSLASRTFLADLPSLESESGAAFSFAHAFRRRSRPSEAIKCAFPRPKYDFEPLSRFANLLPSGLLTFETASSVALDAKASFLRSSAPFGGFGD